MQRTGLLLLFALPFAPLAAAAPDPCSYPPDIVTRTVATAVTQIDSGPHQGHPAVSSASAGASDIGFNLSASSAMAIDSGGFWSRGRTGGTVTIFPFNSNGGSAGSLGSITDCLTFGGYVGGGTAHLPVVLSGGASISWSIGGAYVPAESFDPASARVTINCAAYSYGSNTLSSCADFDLVIDASGAVDQTVEFSFPFQFDDPITLQLSPTAGTGVGYAANGSDGVLVGAANLKVQGAMLPLYVTDSGGTLLPGVTLSATSGHDWLHPTPEPGGAAGSAAAIGALATLLRRAR